MAKTNAARSSVSKRTLYGSPAWIARDEYIRVGGLLLRARQLAAEAARGLAYGRSRGWSTAYAETRVSHTKTRVRTLEALLASAAAERERLARAARRGKAMGTAVAKGQRRAA